MHFFFNKNIQFTQYHLLEKTILVPLHCSIPFGINHLPTTVWFPGRISVSLHHTHVIITTLCTGRVLRVCCIIFEIYF